VGAGRKSRTLEQARRRHPPAPRRDVVLLFAVQEAVVFLIGDEVFRAVGETFGTEGGAVPGVGESADGGQGYEIILGVLRGDLQTIKEESGAARIEFASGERARLLAALAQDDEF
jgi:hypothetical protein